MMPADVIAMVSYSGMATEMPKATRKQRKNASGQRLTRVMLLPMKEEQVRMRSLQVHLALVALRQGQGNAALVGELLKATYITWFLQNGVMEVNTQVLLSSAENILHKSIENATQVGRWELAETACTVIEGLLRLHDAELSTTPAYRVDQAMIRLMQTIGNGELPRIGGGEDSGRSFAPCGR